MSCSLFCLSHITKTNGFCTSLSPPVVSHIFQMMHVPVSSLSCLFKTLTDSYTDSSLLKSLPQNSKIQWQNWFDESFGGPRSHVCITKKQWEETPWFLQWVKPPSAHSRATPSGHASVAARWKAQVEDMDFNGIWWCCWFNGSYPLVMTFTVCHGFSMALIEIDALPFLKMNKNGDFPWLC